MPVMPSPANSQSQRSLSLILATKASLSPLTASRKWVRSHCVSTGHTNLCPPAGGVPAIFSLVSGLSGLGAHRLDCFLIPASSITITGARAAPWQALPCKQCISSSERRKGRGKRKPNLLGSKNNMSTPRANKAPDKVWIVVPRGRSGHCQCSLQTQKYH